MYNVSSCPYLAWPSPKICQTTMTVLSHIFPVLVQLDFNRTQNNLQDSAQMNKVRG